MILGANFRNFASRFLHMGIANCSKREHDYEAPSRIRWCL